MIIRNRSEKIRNIGFFALAIMVNYLANALPINGQTTGQLSDSYQSLFTPAGFTFAIWGVIYLALLGFVVRQSMSRDDQNRGLSKISPLFQLNCVANGLWIVAWHFNQLELSLVLMFVILGTLVRITRLTRIELNASSLWDEVLLVFPFWIYFGWITVATLANISVLQSAYGLNDSLLSQEYWTVIKLVVALVAAFGIGWRYRSATYLFVIAWASYGISVANAEGSLVGMVSLFLALTTVVLGAVALIRNLIPRMSNRLEGARGA